MMKLTLSVPLFCALAVASSASSIQYYVIPNGTGLGTSWVDGASIEFALAAAGSGDTVWVAQGTYKPTNASSGFVFSNGVSVYGGFDTNDTQLQERDPHLNETIPAKAAACIAAVWAGGS